MGYARIRRSWHRLPRRWLALTVIVLSLTMPGLVPASVALTRDFVLTGTVDCGRRSGQPCTIGDTLVLRTADIGGVLEQVVVDVSWLRSRLERRRLDQDEAICLEVRDTPDGRVQAIGLVESCDVDGTVNPGLSTEDRDVQEQPKRDDKDDEDTKVVVFSATPIATATPTATSTATPAPQTASFCNPASIAIPGPAFSFLEAGPAAPYPSTVTTSGLNGTVTAVTVTLRGFTHELPLDVDALLVGPDGRRTILMSDVGGGPTATNLTLTFADGAPPVLVSGPLISGTYRPTNNGPNDTFPPPAPGGSTHPATLSVFSGSEPNGTFSLFVFDDQGRDVGSIANGFCVTISATGG